MLLGDHASCACCVAARFVHAQGFDCGELLSSDYSQLPQEVEAKLGAKYSSLEDMVK